MLSEERLITTNELLDMASISRNTLYRDINSGKITPINFGRNVRYRMSDAQRYAEEKKSSKRVILWQNRKSC